jgi:hypothetical protein
MIEVGWAALGADPRIGLARAAAERLPLAWRRVYDLGPLPLVRAVVAACS